VIEGVYAVRDQSPIRGAGEVDWPGVRVGVKHGSAYDLLLTRTLMDAEVVRGADGIDVFVESDLEVAAGIRQSLIRHVDRHGGLRLLEPRFVEIRQAVADDEEAKPRHHRLLREAIEHLKANGFVEAALERSGQDATVAPPCS
jgi:polar amino acid transport system substrate-binding protein